VKGTVNAGDERQITTIYPSEPELGMALEDRISARGPDDPLERLRQFERERGLPSSQPDPTPAPPPQQPPAPWPPIPPEGPPRPEGF
jgi:hypothetical protein